MYQDREEKKNRQKRTRKNRKKWTTTPYTRLVVISTWTVFEMVNQNHARLSIYEHMRNKHKGNGFTTHLWSFDISFVCCFCCCFFCLFDIFFYFALKSEEGWGLIFVFVVFSTKRQIKMQLTILNELIKCVYSSLSCNFPNETPFL